MLTDIDVELVEEFILESVEMLDDIEPLVLEASTLDSDLANTLFRPVHNIKGTAGCFNFENISKVSHSAENLLSIIRNSDDIEIDIEILIGFFDYLRKALATVMEKHTDEEFTEEANSFIIKLNGLIDDTKGKQPHKKDETKITPQSSSSKLPQLSQAAIESLKELGASAQLDPELLKELEYQEEVQDMPDKKDEETSPVLNIEPIPETVTEIKISLPEETSIKEETTADNEVPNNISSLIDDEALKIFYIEVNELLDDIENNLMILINDLTKTDLFQDIFRSVHTLKGNFGLFDFAELQDFAHKAETIMDKLINNKIEVNSQTIEDLVSFTDHLKEGVDFSTNNNLKSWDKEKHLTLLDKYLNETIQPEKGNIMQNKNDDQKEIKLNISNEPEPQSDPLPEQNNTPSPATSTENKEKKNTSTETEIVKKDIRIDTQKLDYLNDIVGELLIAKTMIFKDIDFTNKRGEQLKKSFHFFSKVLNELQDTSMAMRMIPVSSLFKKMVRIVHDISKKTNKKVKIEFFGESTEVDKSLIDVINNPLLHMLRNSVDHGIEETEEDRIKAGKPREGKIRVGAVHESGEVWIIVSDDGRGLDKDTILKKASETGLIEGDGSQLTDQDIYQLIFAPGFSTAKEVSDISGRGVGMDVVIQNIQKMKGRIVIDSKQGAGTTFTIKIPLTLAIIDGMLVKCGNFKYTIPIESIKESIKAKDKEIDQITQGQQLIKIRNRMIPIVRLNQIHKIKNATEDIEKGILMIVESRGNTVALLVDKLLGQHQTIIKSLPSYFEHIKLNYINGISGCSIQGDGEVGLILDVATLIEKVQERENIKN